MKRKRLWIMSLVLALLLALLPTRHTAWAATVTVNSTTDVSDGNTSSITDLIGSPGADGVISLREAITAANNTSGDDTIAFNIPATTDPGCNAGTGVCTIEPTSELPALTGGGTTIDGYTQPGAAEATDGTPATLLIEINGGSAGINVGFQISSAGNEIRGLVINRFSLCGLYIHSSGATGNAVSGNYIGTDTDGTADLGNSLDGVYVAYGAQNNIIGGVTPAERNVISGNDQHGVYIHGSDTTGNTVSGNYIGTNASGTADLGNSLDGVYIESGAQNNTVGGDTDGEPNVISGNDQYGVRIYGSDTTGNTISGNYIGTDANGTLALGNTSDGIHIHGGAQNNTIGGDTDSERNVISGNYYGVSIYGSGTTGNTVSGNYIGTDVNGTTDLGNSGVGIRIYNGAQNNTVGGDTASERNVISGNDGNGVYISGNDTTGNIVSGNYIGTDVNGTTDLGNSQDGASIDGGAQNNTIERNVISGNDGNGVWIYGSGTMDNTVSGNYIGTNADGTADLGNTQDGVYVASGAQNNTIGGDTPAERNIISGNDGNGVYIRGNGTTGNTVSGNYIGTDANGTTDLGNTGIGIRIYEGAQNNIEQNVISGNDGNGVTISGSGTMNNTVSGNYIGTDANGTVDLGNTDIGVYIGTGAQNNTIGGYMASERNVISGNDQHGVEIYGSNTMSNTISGNYIGTDASGTADLGNAQAGVYIRAGAQNNTIGGDTASERNVISGNDQHGVRIYDSGTTGNTVSGNHIGTDAGGTLALGNISYGVYLHGGAQNNTVGPDNVIAHNGYDGVAVDGSSTTGNTITQNSIFSNDMGIDLTNGANGDIAAPVIVTTTVGSVNVVGTACAGCTVEVFMNSDTDGEGETYVGDTTATASGAFTVTVSSLGDPYLTATATDARGTSEFSEVFTATLTGGSIYLPIIFRSY